MNLLEKALSSIFAKFRDVYGDAFYECFVSLHRENNGGEVKPAILIRELLHFHKDKSRKDFLVKVSVLNFRNSVAAGTAAPTPKNRKEDTSKFN